MTASLTHPNRENKPLDKHDLRQYAGWPSGRQWRHLRKDARRAVQDAAPSADKKARAIAYDMALLKLAQERGFATGRTRVRRNGSHG